jgi:hypothetical protein
MQAVLITKKQKAMKKKKIILLVIAIALLSGGWYAYSEYTRKVKDLSKVKADMHLQTNELVSQFEKDESGANALYLDKVIAVKGTLKAIEKDEANNYSLVLGDENSMSSVRCSMDEDHQQKVQGLITGAKVTVKGACTGFNADDLLGSDVILNRCVVQD